MGSTFAHLKVIMMGGMLLKSRRTTRSLKIVALLILNIPKMALLPWPIFIYVFVQAILILSFQCLFLYVMALDLAIPIRSHLVLHSAFVLFTRRFSLGLRTKSSLRGSRQVPAHFYYAHMYVQRHLLTPYPASGSSSMYLSVPTNVGKCP